MTRSDLVSDGLVTFQSAHGVTVTVKCLKAELVGKGLRLFAHIAHAAEAQKVGLSLRPTQVLIFGDPRAGTPLMQSEQTVGLDLPLRVLVWEDAGGKIWMAYTELQYLARHYGITDRDKEVEAMSTGLTTLTHAALSR